MTPRQQMARKLRDKGMTQQEIAIVMGICQSRVSSLLRLNKGLAGIQRKYLRTPAGHETHKRSSEQWRLNNRERILETARAWQKAYRQRKKLVDLSVLLLPEIPGEGEHHE